MNVATMKGKMMSEESKVFTYNWEESCECEECKEDRRCWLARDEGVWEKHWQKTQKREAWADGLSTRAHNFIFTKAIHQFNSREDLLKACNEGRLEPWRWRRCGYGKKTYNEIREWLGLPKEVPPPTERQTMLSRIAELEAEVKRLNEEKRDD